MKAVLFALALLLVASPARADGVVVNLEGPYAPVVGRQIAGVLERVPDSAVARVEGQITRVRRTWRADLRATDAQGRELARRTVQAPRLTMLARRARAWAENELSTFVVEVPVSTASEVREIVPSPSGVSSRRADAAGASVVTSAAAPQPAAPAPDEDARRPRLPPPLAMTVGFAVTNRSFTYNDDIFGTLAPYELPAAPVVTLAAEWTPGGHADLGVLSGLSVWAQGELGVGIESVGAQGDPHPTEMWSVGGGLRYRVRIDDVELSVEGGYRGVGFAIRDASETQPRPEVPNVEIHAALAGAGFRWDIGGGVFFVGRGAYLAPFSAGEIASEAWFPRASVGGLEANAGVGLRVDDVEFRALFAMRRFWYAMGSEPGDARVAGGAVDQYLSGVLELAWLPSQLAAY